MGVSPWLWFRRLTRVTPDPSEMPDAPDLLDRLRAALLAAGLGPTNLDIAPANDPEGRTLAAGLVLLYPYPLARSDRPASTDARDAPTRTDARDGPAPMDVRDGPAS